MNLLFVLTPKHTATLLLAIKASIKYVRKVLNNKVDSIKPQKCDVQSEFSDKVYYIINSTYESLSVFRTERERQAKSSYNAALSLIIGGILIIFGGVYLLYQTK